MTVPVPFVVQDDCVVLDDFIGAYICVGSYLTVVAYDDGSADCSSTIDDRPSLVIHMYSTLILFKSRRPLSP